LIMGIRFVHGADFHLDSAFDALGPEKAALRRGEQRQMLSALADLCRREEAQLLLLAGDLLDSDETYAETGEMLQSLFASLTIPIFISPGNHDRVSRLSPYKRLPLPGNVHVFTRPEIECVELPELGVRLWGAGYTDRRCPPLLSGFEAAKDGDTLDILLLHGEVGRPDSPYCPITVRELARSGMDYVALGHDHRFSGLRRAEDCFYAWPGCMEGRGFDECGEKGVLVGELSPDSCSLRFVPMGGRRYECLSVPAGEEPLSSVLAALPPDTQRGIYRICLTGERTRPLDLAALRAGLEERFFALELRDETVPGRDLWERAGENSLHGLFLRRMQQRLEAAADPEEREVLIMAVRAGVAALDGREEPF